MNRLPRPGSRLAEMDEPAHVDSCLHGWGESAGRQLDCTGKRKRWPSEARRRPPIWTSVLDRSQPPRGRRLAYELLLRVDPAAEDRLVPQMLDDPARELRRDAVERVIAEARSRGLEKGADKQAAVATYQRAASGKGFGPGRDRL